MLGRLILLSKCLPLCHKSSIIIYMYPPIFKLTKGKKLGQGNIILTVFEIIL